MAETLQSLLLKSDTELVELCAFDPARKADRSLQIKIREGITRLFDQKHDGNQTAIAIRDFIVNRANARIVARAR